MTQIFVGIIVTAIVGLPSYGVACAKGFKPGNWLFALGPVGLVFVLCLPSAKSKGITEKQASQRAASANKISGVLFGIWALLSAIGILLPLMD